MGSAEKCGETWGHVLLLGTYEMNDFGITAARPPRRERVSAIVAAVSRTRERYEWNQLHASVASQ